MGISPSTFNNLPVMTNQELQNQIRNELSKAVQDGKKHPQAMAQVTYDYQTLKQMGG